MTENQIASGNEREVDIPEFLSKLIRWWPLFAAFLFISLVVGYLYLRYTTPIYSITASLLIKQDQNSSNSSSVMEALDIFGPAKNVGNEIKVLESKTISRQVVQNLSLYAPVKIEGRIVEGAAYTISPIVVKVQYPDSISLTDNIYFSYDSVKKEVIIKENRYSLNQWHLTPYGNLKFLVNPYKVAYLNSDPGKLYFQLIPVNKVSSSLISKLKVVLSNRESTVIDLSITDEIPLRGENILNEWINVYNNEALEDKNKLARNTIRFIEERLGFIVQELDSVEGKLQRFKASNSITDISVQGQIFLENVSFNDQKVSELEMQLAALSEVEDYIKNKKSDGSITPAIVGLENRILGSLLEALNEKELSYERAKTIVPENNPSLLAIKTEIEKLRPTILDNVLNQRKTLLASKRKLSETNADYLSYLKTIPQKERQLLDISRQQSIKNNIYTFLLQKREEAALSYASAVADNRVIDRAQAIEFPVSPKIGITYLLSIVFAIISFVLIISLLEIVNTTIRSREEIKKIMPYPILGDVNFDKNSSPLTMLDNRNGQINEQFRHLRTSLRYIGIGHNKKKILITSSISGEGKSFVTANLGISLAIAGKKVVLIELDLRKPKLVESFSGNRRTGISNYLIGHNKLNEIIQKTSIDNLHIVSAGPLPPNPSELIMNDKLPNLLDELEKLYDIILIDTAPIGPVTDAFLISPQCDATIFIVRHEYTPKSMLKRMKDVISRTDLNNIAIIYNGVKTGFGSYGYGYGYGKSKYGYV
jgi:capsular exopolysaccharide synthesis family protein